MMEKNQLRNHMKTIRDFIIAEEKDQYDRVIFNKVINSEYYNKSSIIFVYVSFNSEVDTHRIIKHALENNKIICVPKIINKTKGMKAVRINTIEELKRNSFGILEPENFSNIINPEEIELMIIPGLAFDKKGGRVGYGAGYYDKYIKAAKKNIKKVGLAYRFQLVSEVPKEEHDVVMDVIITD
ncbi:5-formyltetrahydrofolate cyclo-ligase [Clostridium sp. SYSU_GA19001]|uniref:5-formyltetrahydrofolate cyclo-ligase n=1 Tax=Clostridium caldaquaticum TaxID=2940653 RepID=UPI0020773C88|nr:5-formyltetrahydrofolate cyclo-ligase [Clostridium caldaquaticum]MCM8710349.1 5-formyltetrahydrofolate cyclo-ligase [Clostridium caldaquaticum]